MKEDEVDITEHRRAEQALRESEERFRLAAKAGRMFAYSWDATTDVIVRSGESAKILGIDEAALLTGQQAIARVYPDDREGLLAAMAGLSPERPFLQVTYRIVRPDASVIWVERHSRAYFDEYGKTERIVGMVVDVTERKLAEQELATAIERLHFAIESGLIGGWEWDVKRGKTHWFGKAHAQLGMTPDDTVGSREEFWERVHEDDRDDLRHAMHLARVRHEGFIHDFRVVWRDGTIHWLCSRGRYYYAENGEPERMLGISTDITKSKQAEEALRESEQRLRLAAQVGRMYAYDWDVTTNVVVRSSEHVNILGLTEMLRLSQQQFMDKIHPDDRAKFFGAIAGLTPENPTGEVTYRALTSDGTVWLKSNGRGFFDAEGKLQRVIGMVADVTGQRLAEEALRASEERLRMGQWAAHVGTFDVNIRTGADIWTPETEALYGLPPGGFGGSLTAFENLIHPDDRKQVMELTHKMMRTGEPTEGEWRVVWPDGSVHWIASRGQVLMDESGEPSRMLGVNLDITERKRAEEALSDMTRKLVEAQEQERVRIARELHDDINQRLALVAIGLDQLREKHTDLPTKVRDKMQELQHMTADISSGVYAMSHDLHPLTPDPSDLAMAMRGWCNEFGKRQKMEIIFRSNDLPRVPQAVSLCLFRVLQEALHNSARHSGVKRVEVQLAKNSGHIDLIVSDSGKGFDIKAARQSQGLGVTSMQERVRLIGGTIVIDAKLPAGTTIHVCVPFKPERDGQRQVAPD